jgi:hypothetical protein
MRVQIDREEKTTGLLKKTTQYTVKLTVQFSETELAIIKQRKLDDLIVYKYPYVAPFSGPGEMEVMVKMLRTPSYRSFPTIIDAEAFEQKLRDEILPTLKEYIETSAMPSKKSSAFEL